MASIRQVFNDEIRLKRDASSDAYFKALRPFRKKAAFSSPCLFGSPSYDPYKLFIYDPYKGIEDEFYYFLAETYLHNKDKKENPNNLRYHHAQCGPKGLLSLFRAHTDEFATCFFGSEADVRATLLASFNPKDRDEVALAIAQYKPRHMDFKVKFSRLELGHMLNLLKSDLKDLSEPYQTKLFREFHLVDREITLNEQERLVKYIDCIQNIEQRALQNHKTESSWRFFFSSPSKKAIGLCEHALEKNIPKGYLQSLKTQIEKTSVKGLVKKCRVD